MQSAGQHRKFNAKRLIVASHNQGKVREITELFEPFRIEILSAGELDLPEPDETGSTFIENAELKAQAAAQATGQIALADDSGLAVHALNGAPGIFSARWAGPTKDFTMAMARVHEALESAGARDTEAKRAHFVCALSLAWPDGHLETFEGKVYGTIIWPMRGNKGFGYDPIFKPDGHDITFAEMQHDAKHAISHRADAFRQLIAAVFTP